MFQNLNLVNESAIESPNQTNTMKPRIQLPLAVLSSLCALTLVPAVLATDEPIMNTPDELPPLGEPGWYSAPGQSVSFYVEYGTNQGLPAKNSFTGVFLEAHDMIVDNFQNVTRSYVNNDERIHFDAQLTASVTTLSGIIPKRLF